MSPSVSISRMAEPKPTKVFDTFWRFATERQEVFFRRLDNQEPPWTTDPIIQTYRFTNAYRAADRLSQFLIQNVIYRGDQSHKEVFFRAALFRVFNNINTWQTFERELGFPSSAEFSVAKYGQLLDRLKDSGGRVYGGAYIIPPVRLFSSSRKHWGHLKLLEHLLGNGIIDRVENAASMSAAYSELLTIPSFGRFLSFQLLVDLNYGPSLAFDEMDFVVAGPGAQSGLRKCFVNAAEWSEEDLIRWVTERQSDELEKRGLEFRCLWGRPLKLIDVQNLFCEIDKYSRVAHPAFTAEGGRTRLKRKYTPLPLNFQYSFPPKWKLAT